MQTKAASCAAMVAATDLDMSLPSNSSTGIICQPTPSCNLEVSSDCPTEHVFTYDRTFLCSRLSAKGETRTFFYLWLQLCSLVSELEDVATQKQAALEHLFTRHKLRQPGSRLEAVATSPIDAFPCC